MVAKRFFYVCAGLLCLALAYHLGARSATAQASSGVECANVNEFQNTTCAVIGRLFYWQPRDIDPPLPYTPTPVPGTSPIVACGIDSRPDAIVLLANGEVWQCSNYQSNSWVLVATYPAGAPTPATQETWGGVKARYRQGAAATPRDK